MIRMELRNSCLERRRNAAFRRRSFGMKRILSLFLALILISMIWIVPASAAVYGTVRGGWLRLRAQPSYKAYVITSYPTGTVVTILSQSGGWCQVVTPDQRLGYMDQRYLNISGSSTPSYVSPTYPTYPTSGSWYDVNYTAYVTSANGKGVRLRRNPVVNSYNVLGLYPVGRKVTVLKRSNTGWSYIRIGSQEGYMMSQYLTTSYYPVYPTAVPYVPVPTQTPRPSRYAAYLTSDNGRNIYLRRDASMNFQYIASYPVGTRVTVLGTEGSWTKVLVDGLEGYVQSIYVTTRKPSVPGSGSGTIYYPDPAEEPAYVDPDPGYSDYPGPSSGTGGQVIPGRGITSVRLTVNNPKVGEMVTVIVAPNTAEYSAVWYRDDNVLLTTGNRYTVQATDVGHVIYVRVTGTGSYSGTVVEAMTGTVRAGSAATPTPVPEGVMESSWVDYDGYTLPEAVYIPETGTEEPHVTEEHAPPVDPSSGDGTVVSEWVDPTPIDSWWTGEEEEGTVNMEWVESW